MRGRGWLSSFSIGNPAPDRGVPLVSAFRWDTGVQVHAANDVVDGDGVGDDRHARPTRSFSDDNAGKQIAGRVALRPVAGPDPRRVGGARSVRHATARARAAVGDGHDGDFTQTAWGADVEYSRGYYLVRVETIVSHWRCRSSARRASTGRCARRRRRSKGRYKIRPGLYVAARVDHLGFSDDRRHARHGSRGTRRSRALEVGGGYSMQRNLAAQDLVSSTTRATAAGCTTRTSAAAQMVFWF